MKSLLTKFASSFSALLADSTILDLDGKIEDIRTAMLELMAPYIDFEADVPTVWSRVMGATDIPALWYLRTDVLGFLADQCGESTARGALANITEMFRGSMPDSHMPKQRSVGNR